MAATSPYQGNDYQAVSNYRPYDLPVNDIFKGIVAQNQFWEAGAARVKSAYDNALNLNLTTDENKDVRKRFMEDADKQLTKLSTMDLSDPSVQRQGFGIFRPLLKDKSIIQDDYLSNLQTKIFSDAERYKRDEKTKGSGYNMDNLAYAMRPFKGFGRTTSRDQLDGIFEKAKNAEYIPYYDIAKERKDILDMCKPDKATNTTTQGMHLESEKISSLTSQKLWGCLESQLSGQARQQIRITGAVRYGDDYNTLKQEYISAAESKSKYYDDQIRELSASKASLVGKTDTASVAAMKEIDDNITQLGDAKEKYDEHLLTYHTWDDKYMHDNYEDLASTAWMHREEGAFADAFARMDIEKDKKADPVGMMYYTQQKLDERQQAGLKFKLLSGDTEMDVPGRIRALKNMGVPDDQIYTWLGEASKEKAPESAALQSTIDNTNNSISEKVSDIVNSNEIQSNPALATIVNGVKDEKGFTEQLPRLYKYVNDALTKGPNNAKAISLREGLNEYIKLTNTRTQYKSLLDDAWRVAEKQQPTLFDRSFTKDLKDIHIKETGEVISVNDILDAQEGRSSKYTFENYNYVLPTFTSPTTMVTTGGETIVNRRLVDKNGRVVIDEKDSPYWQDISKIFRKSDENLGKKTTIVNNILGQNAAVQKMILSSGNLLGDGKINSAKPTQTLRQVQDIFGNAFAEYNTVGGFDPVDGWVNVQAKDEKGKIVPYNALKDAAAASQMGASQILEGDYPNSIKIKVPYLVGVVNEPDYNETLKSLMTYAGNRVTGENLPQGLIVDAGITPNGKKVQINTTKNLGSGLPKYTILVNGVEIPVKIANDQTTALNFVSMLISGKAESEIKK